MNMKKGIGLLTALTAMATQNPDMGDYMYERKSKGLLPKNPIPYKSTQGMKTWDIDGIEVEAVTKKAAIKKANKLKI